MNKPYTTAVYHLALVLVFAFALPALALPLIVLPAFAQKVEVFPMEHNSSVDDFASSLSMANRLLFVTSERDGKQSIYLQERSSGGWRSPDRIDGELNQGAMVGSPTVTSDGQYMVFAAFEHSVPGKGRTDLYSAQKVGGKWTNIRNLSALNSDAWDSQPTLSADGSMLLFSSDRMGNADIYIARKSNTGWSTPQPVSFNSESEEMTPWIAADNSTIYFASDRPGGAGGYDIYATRMSGSGFSAPTRLPEPINSTANEYYYIALTNSDQAYFASDRSGGQGMLDVYFAAPNPFPASAVTIVQGKVLDAVSKDRLGADITVTDLKTGKRAAELRSDDQDGSYSVTLIPGRIYSITASKSGYLFYSERYEVPPDAKATVIEKDLLLSPISEGDTRLLVFFDFAKFSLQDESIPELERIVEFLKANPGVRVAFEGHTDDVGDPEPNKTLSQRRANSVLDYVANAGIAKDRLQARGLGEDRPKVQIAGLTGDDLTNARAMNRRVEMKVQK